MQFQVRQQFCKGGKMNNQKITETPIKITSQNTILHIVDGPDQWGIIAGYYNAYVYQDRRKIDHFERDSAPKFVIQPTFMIPDPHFGGRVKATSTDRLELQICPTHLSYRAQGDFQLIEGHLCDKVRCTSEATPHFFEPILPLFQLETRIMLLYHPHFHHQPLGVIVECENSQKQARFQIPPPFAEILHSQNQPPRHCRVDQDVRSYQIQRKNPKGAP